VSVGIGNKPVVQLPSHHERVIAAAEFFTTEVWTARGLRITRSFERLRRQAAATRSASIGASLLLLEAAFH
jgi:hypothetical protein